MKTTRTDLCGAALRAFVAAGLLAMLAGCMGYVPGRQSYWDAKVKEMCEKEGGIKVFQTVNLDPKEYGKLLNKNNQIDIPNEKLADPTDTYVYSFESEHIVDGALKVRKDVQRVLKRPERTVLAEQITFSRIGGDLPTGFGHATYSSCPPSAETLFSRTFRRIQGEGS